MEHKKKTYVEGLLISNLIASTSVAVVFIWFWLKNKLKFNFELLWTLELIVMARIFMFIGFSFILYKKWFKQESVFLTDAYFLFGIFFNILSFGKTLDLFSYLANVSGKFMLQEALTFLKIRYLIIVVNLNPLLFIGLGVVLNIISTYVRELSTAKINRTRMRMIYLYNIISILVILLAPTIDVLTQSYAILISISMIGIILMFFIMYKFKGLSQAHGLIIGIGFLSFIIVGFITSPLRSAFANNPTLIELGTLAEMIDMVVYCIVFAGFLLKPKYAKNETIILEEKQDYSEHVTSI
ncbi:MAG: hypothetical protein ACTSUN_03100 [Promethearchaeota archaeon]